jgi:hypothetical protein
MASTLKGKVPAYLDQYARTLGAAYRVEAIRRDIASEQDQVRYIDSLISQAANTAASLEAALQAQPPASLETATALLKEQYDAENASRTRRAGEGVAARRSVELTPEDRAAFTVGRNQSKEAVALAAETAAKRPGTTPEKAAAIAAFAEKQLGADYPGLANIRAAVGQPAAAGGARAQPKGVRAQTPEEAARQETLNQLFESTYFAGPSGIVGGYEGKAVADLRPQTKAPPSTGFATAEDAFVAAVNSLENGTIEREDFDSDDAFNYAREIYAEAKVAKAFRNDQRTAFEPAVLSARKQVAELKKERERAVGTTYNDPGQESIRRELIARGYKLEAADSKDAWKNAYVKYQKTDDYGVYIGAHERVRDALSAGEALSPNTRAERLAVQYTGMKLRRGDSLSVQDLRDQLKRVGYDGKIADEAVAFAMAYTELGGEDQSPERRAKLQGLEADAATQAKAREAEVTAADQVLKAAEEARNQIEKDVADYRSRGRLRDADEGGLTPEALERVQARSAAPPAPPPLPQAQRDAASGELEGGLLSGSRLELQPPTPEDSPGPAPAALPTKAQLEAQRAELEARRASGGAPGGLVADPVIGVRTVGAPSARTKELLDVLSGKTPAPRAAPARAPAPAPAPRAPAPAAPAPKAPAPAPRPPAPTGGASKAEQARQLKALLASDAIPRGSAQYNALLDRLDELEAQ